MGETDNRVVLLQPDLLEQLTEKLKQDLPNSLTVLGPIHLIARGRLDGHVYTNGWPSYSAVVCQYKGVTTQWFFCCYTTNTEDLSRLLCGTKTILSTQKNGFLVESHVANELVKEFKFSDTEKIGTEFSSSILARIYYLPKVMEEPRACPEGYTLRKLEERHAEFLSLYWTHMDDAKLKRTYIKSLITRFHNVGLFHKDEDTPVAWCLQHPFGQLGHLYVTEGHRRHGFASLLAEHMCKLIQDDGAVPQAAVEWRNTPCIKLMAKLGFVERNMHTFFSTCHNSNSANSHSVF